MVTKELVEEIYKLISNLHDLIIDQSGGEKGVRDDGGLYHSINKILLHHKEHENPLLLAAFIYEELARRHHFVDGNKRTAHITAKIILYLHGSHLKLEYKQATDFIIKIAEYDSKISTNEIVDWIEPHIISIAQNDMENYLKNVIKEVINGK